ncbi:cell division protein ZapA [Fretibacter rubidus]|uniref:cell division protein ZapA n=1 Tax=Fretibacter rubidus TaxID=570162 RepID=UPI00352A0AE5
MAKVSIDINGRKYALGCDDGEEDRLMRLGQKLDERVKMLANQFGQIGDLRLLVMAGITLSDELDEVTGNISGEAEKMTAQMRKDSEAALAAAKSSEYEATDSLIKAAERIELLAARLADKKD